jgi:predicted nucleic acid-binding protein
MRPVFADSHYFLALLSRSDTDHGLAVKFSQNLQSLITTQWVLTEVGDGLAHPARREQFLRLLGVLQDASETEVVPASAELFARGVQLYGRRPDKHWSLTDCISFVVMQERGIEEALTGDRHFELAGFTALLK